MNASSAVARTIRRTTRRVAPFLIGLTGLSVGAVLAFAACASVPGSTATSGHASPSAGSRTSDGPIAESPTGADWARLGEVWHVLGEAGPRVWAGWGTDPPPLLLRTDAHDYLVGHPSAPAGFVPVAGLSVADRPVSRREGHMALSIGVQRIGDRLGVVVLPRDGLQAVVDEVLGPDAITLDDVQYVRWVAHEAFHVHQMATMSGDLPSFGFEGDEMEVITALTDTEGFPERLADEGRSLARALGTRTDAELRDAVASFVASRVERRASLGGEVAAYERAVEWTEGLARFSDVRLLQAAGDGYEPSAAFAALGVRYPEPDVAWTDAIRWLDDLSSVPGTVRDRYYELGAAEAYVLDRLMPGWQTRALPGGESLESLLQAGLAAADADLPVKLRALAAPSPSRCE